MPDPRDRIYAIGDVHGRHDLLEALLLLLKADAWHREDERQPVLVFLGNLIGRGEGSRDAVDLAIGALLTWPRVILLRGNREAALLTFLDRPEAGAAWLEGGAAQTLKSYGLSPPPSHSDAESLRSTAAELAAIMGPHRKFLSDARRMFVSGDVVFAHAGIDPARPLEDQKDDALIWGRSSFLDQGAPKGLRVVHGHWNGPEPVVTPSRICVDTGAHLTGRLTAVRLDRETEMISVDAVDL